MNILVTGGLGLIGHNVVKRLQDQGHVVSIMDTQTNYGIIPQEEIDYLINNHNRNRFIRNLAISLNTNTLVLYQMVERHGQILYDMIKEKAGDRKVFFIHGGVETEDRESVRQIMEKENDAIIVASFGTFSTGINIRNLHNIIFASPSKSRVRNLQSIGRGLRKADDKDAVEVFDIASKCKFSNRHLLKRKKFYNEVQYPFTISKIIY